MKSLKLIMVALFVLSITSCNAQLKNTKTETVKIFGNCGMCKNTIEKAGNKKKEATVEWNKDSKIATIAYDSLKTSKTDVLKRIALVGYDNELFVSPNDTYENLPGCCQYERAKKEVILTETPKMEMVGNHTEHKEEVSTKENHSEHTTSKTMEMPKTTTEIVKIDQLKPVFDTYFEVKNALVQSDGALTSTKATNLLKALESVKMNTLEMDAHMVWMKVMKDLKADANIIAESKDENTQRANFVSLSNNMYSLLKVAKYETPVYYQHCPMANDGKGANWLSKENAVKNPYYGSMMLSCGKTVETINK